MNKINVLDKGYVRLVNEMGSDLTVANAARVSYDKESKELTDKDIRLIKFLAREGHCYDEETEVLTDRGFMPWNLVNKETKLGAVRPETGEFLGFEKPIDIVQEEFDGDLLHFETNDIDLMVTKGHSIYCSLTNKIDKRSNPEFELHVADKKIKCSNGTPEKFLYEKPMRMLKAVTGNKLPDIDNNPLQFSLYGFFIGDGFASTKNTIQFHLKKARKITYIKNILEKLGLEYSEYTNSDKTIRISVQQDGIGDKYRMMFYTKDKEKTFPDHFLNMSKKEAEHFFEGLKNSDGSQKRNTWVYSTASKNLANKLQALMAINGLSASLHSNKNNNLYGLNINSRRNMPRLNENNDNKVKIHKYNGKVYCATVSTGLLIVRRNNKVILCGNTSPFRHAFLQFEVYAPLMVARQWWKYVVGSDHTMDSWNESSRRYITEEPTFYIPSFNEWRSKPENSKQGSGDYVPFEIGNPATKRLMEAVDKQLADYEWALENGICAEQARLFLPAYGLYVRWYWSTSLQGVCHFLAQRLEHDAQKEIQDYAKAVLELTKYKFPISVEELLK